MTDFTLLPPRSLPDRARFQEAARQDRLRVSRVDGLELFCYNNTTFYEQMGSPWDPVARAARGITFDQETGELVALPFPKFFNLGEHERVEPERLPDEPIRVTEKLDGTMIIAFHDGRRWRTATKGSLESPQAQWAYQQMQEQFSASRLDGLEELTLLFEGIYPKGTFEDDLVLDYGQREELVLLTAYHTPRRAELRAESVQHLAEQLEAPRPTFFDYDSPLEARRVAQHMPVEEGEGFVIQFHGSGQRVKVKSPHYVAAAKLLQGSPLLTLWEHMDAQGQIDRELLEVVPAGQRDDLMAQVRYLERVYRRLRTAAEERGLWATRKPGSEREIAAWIKEQPEPLQPAIFGAWRGNRKQVHDVIHKMIRPDNNEIDQQADQLAQQLSGLDQRGRNR